MCGPETPSSTPRVGARVDFFSRTSSGPIGNLLFLNPSSPSSSHATHVRFHQPPRDGKLDPSIDITDQILVSIQFVSLSLLGHPTGSLVVMLTSETAQFDGRPDKTRLRRRSNAAVHSPPQPER